MSGAATLTPALSQRERESDILPSFPRRRESRRREAPLLSHVGATSFPRRREPTAATRAPALSQRERESNILPSFPRRRESRRRAAPLFSRVGATSFPRRREPTATTRAPALSQRERESNILPSFPRRRESRRRKAPLLSYVRATSFPRKREPTADRSTRATHRFNSLSLWRPLHNPSSLQRRRESRRREAPLLSYVSATSFPRKREPTGCWELCKGLLWERAGVRVARVAP